MPAPEPVLVVAAHPDDEVLGCGATMARLAAEGAPVHIAILGEGITSRQSRRDDSDAELLRRLHQQAEAAALKVGAKDVVLFKLPDNRLDTLPIVEVAKLVEELVRKLRPTVIYTHHPGDLNVDHGIVHRAVLIATRPLLDHPVRQVLTFEVPSSTEWSFQKIEPVFRPNVFVDVSKTLDAKIAALACYDSETRDFPHPRSAQALRAIATRWGSVIGCAAAESFELVRSIR
jgi:LmbE family N-acetylglucosaminyl deacetylase